MLFKNNSSSVLYIVVSILNYSLYFFLFPCIDLSSDNFLELVHIRDTVQSTFNMARRRVFVVGVGMTKVLYKCNCEEICTQAVTVQTFAYVVLFGNI